VLRQFGRKRVHSPDVIEFGVENGAILNVEHYQSTKSLSMARLCQWGPTRYGKSGSGYPMTFSITKGVPAALRGTNRTKLLATPIISTWSTWKPCSTGTTVGAHCNGVHHTVLWGGLLFGIGTMMRSNLRVLANTDATLCFPSNPRYVC
jgi:hypothetical protein